MSITNKTKMTFTAAALLAGTALASTGMAQTAASDNETVDHVEVGSLSCDVGDGTGFIFGSTRELVCTFNPVQEGLPDETYVGEINRYGIDIGKTQNGQMGWLVFAPTEAEYSEGGLNGTYRGVSAGATLGVGLGANAMVGGSEDTLALQPISVNTQTGVNFAVGVGEINLQRIAN
ncbi:MULTISPECIES: DUF992 domain-containing protein [unclassified Sulfitobacter]|uniref:DUF992 domain-containing protein n=1 Tax=unclassified Sulfitobacter TaxID=196795 RepID=UPI0007C28051|nr:MULTISPECIES: DUF992 domain-containing protein [unclassified Sulfitobacter]KZY05197.1 hypothetical protein A3721_02400 [Sulfitobacter sp. HI0023]KZY24203.1 hypothetical protein A3728_06055 [Sulfitobacter sp. HI0040]KZZ71271.1 hypothetical protein A3764_07015 [Sulfitobacter sp. HI0129]